MEIWENVKKFNIKKIISIYIVGGGPSLPHFIKEVNKGDTEIEAFIHVGDFAYDLFDLGGWVGDDFFRYM